MNIGDVAKRLGLPASTIRYYEQIGLIKPQQRVSGRRKFDPEALFALEFVRLAQTAGFKIAEIQLLLDAYENDPGPAGQWVTLAEKKRTELHKQIEELKQMDSILSELLSCDCKSLTECVEKGMKRSGKSPHARN